MKVGEYFRTIDGRIGKITRIPKHHPYFDDGFYLNDEFIVCGCEIMEELETEKDILDLIEPMDLLLIDISPDDCGGIVVPRIPETQRELNKFIKYIKSKRKRGTNVLKGITTKEKITEGMYKIGE